MHTLLASGHGLDGLADVFFAAIGTAMALVWVGPALILWLTRRENRAAAWVVLAWQALPVGLLGLGFAISSEVFDGPVTERLVDNGHRVHDPEPYLNNPTTGEVVSRMLTG